MSGFSPQTAPQNQGETVFLAPGWGAFANWVALLNEGASLTGVPRKVRGNAALLVTLEDGTLETVGLCIDAQTVTAHYHQWNPGPTLDVRASGLAEVLRGNPVPDCFETDDPHHPVLRLMDHLAAKALPRQTWLQAVGQR